MVARQGQMAIARAMENGQVQQGRHPGRDHQRVSTAVEHLYKTHDDAIPEIRELNFASVSVTETCTACGVCARVCPTGALQFEKSEEEVTYALKFSPRQCIGCELCTHVCLPAAISVDHEPTFTQIFGAEAVVLREGELVKCEHCGLLMAKRGDAHLCSLCEYRQTHPFGSMLPPGLSAASRWSRRKSNDH